ncbi:MAG TPA: MFS transporter [Desulfobacterales bacterium]|nr:MFS transporter [Desulfobacterales bacterium]
MSRRWAIFVIASGNFFLSQFYRVSNAVISPQLLRDLSLDTAGLGLLSASFFYGFAITQIPISIFLDRIGPRRMMAALSLIGIIGALIFSWADTLSLGIVGRALLGIGMACNLMGTLKLLTLWFGAPSFATLSGVVFSIGTLGNMVATTPLVMMVEKMGWRATFQLIAAVNLLMVLIFYIVVRDEPKEGSFGRSAAETGLVPRQALSDLMLLLRQKDYWIISFGTFVSYGIFVAFQALWAGPYLMEAMGLSARNAGHIIFLMNLGLILGGGIWGALSDKVMKTRKWPVSGGHIILGFITMIVAVLPPGIGTPLLASLFFGFGFFRMTGVLMYTQIKELMPIEMAGTAMTGINFFTMIGSAVFLQGLGSLMQYLYPETSRGPEAFRVAFFLCAICLVVLSFLYLFTQDTKRKSQ